MSYLQTHTKRLNLARAFTIALVVCACVFSYTRAHAYEIDADSVQTGLSDLQGSTETLQGGLTPLQMLGDSADYNMAPVAAVAYCGNGVREQGEACDDSDGDATCVSLGYAAGTLACDAQCAWDTSGCGTGGTSGGTGGTSGGTTGGGDGGSGGGARGHSSIAHSSSASAPLTSAGSSAIAFSAASSVATSAPTTVTDGSQTSSAVALTPRDEFSSASATLIASESSSSYSASAHTGVTAGTDSEPLHGAGEKMQGLQLTAKRLLGSLLPSGGSLSPWLLLLILAEVVTGVLIRRAYRYLARFEEIPAFALSPLRPPLSLVS